MQFTTDPKEFWEGANNFFKDTNLPLKLLFGVIAIITLFICATWLLKKLDERKRK